MRNAESVGKEAILLMLKKAQTKVIFPIITFGLLTEFLKTGKKDFIDSEVRKAYHSAIAFIQDFIGHKLHTGGKYYDAYPIRNLPRYGVLIVNGKSFAITELFQDNANELIRWIPEIIKNHIESKIGLIPTLGNDIDRLKIATDKEKFQSFIENNIALNPSNFEVFSFSILRIHLEKFA